MNEAFYRLKKGVSMANLHPGVYAALPAIAVCVWEVFGRIMVLTSGRDGRHSKTSDHYLGRSIDIRIWRWLFPTTRRRDELARKLQRKLGSAWYVHVHSTHIHLSYRGEGYKAEKAYWRPKAGGAPDEENL